jgi:hypothetical protein
MGQRVRERGREGNKKETTQTPAFVRRGVLWVLFGRSGEGNHGALVRGWGFFFGTQVHCGGFGQVVCLGKGLPELEQGGGGGGIEIDRGGGKQAMAEKGKPIAKMRVGKREESAAGDIFFLRRVMADSSGNHDEEQRNKFELAKQVIGLFAGGLAASEAESEVEAVDVRDEGAFVAADVGGLIGGTHEGALEKAVVLVGPPVGRETVGQKKGGAQCGGKRLGAGQSRGGEELGQVIGRGKRTPPVPVLIIDCCSGFR